MNIRFEERIVEDRKKTREWLVKAEDGGKSLGEVKWYAPWRCYAFFPYVRTLFEKDCLRDLAYFCDLETQKHRAGWKRRKS
jgi:hypothetical protein